MDVIDLTGKTFGWLKVTKYIGKTGHHKNKKTGKESSYHTWECICKCGAVKQVRSTKLRNGTTKSCGCKKKTYKPKWTLPEGEAAKNLLLYQYKESAKKRSLEFSLTKDKFIELTSSNCYYCACEPGKSVAMRQKGNSNGRSLNGDYLYNGIDRINNAVGYIEENCIPCCWTCNELKKNKGQEEFIEHIKKIVDNINGKS